ncbi:DUF6468 domain-containing protein [Acetobacter conturbans]|uniref:DUF6468 domain-containing protein n=1 Tax=Acetobacter conturbans TaxID=1737472 RepID=A0ABX0JX66_9PROT|nr:DUF6468 domain-containing protein [Acetobacter conturbans]NHN87914.1 hypothetical protein [Acetobacter conturbans]
MTVSQYIIEITLCFLLVLGIFYSIHLGKALSILRRDRRELAELVGRLDESGKRAESGIEKLRTAGDVSGRSLSRMIDQSKMLQNELEMLAERADALAGRLEGVIREGRQVLPEVSTAGGREAEMPLSEQAEPVEMWGSRETESVSTSERASLPSLPASPVMDGSRSYEQKRRQRTAAEQDLIRALRMS